MDINLTCLFFQALTSILQDEKGSLPNMKCNSLHDKELEFALSDGQQ
jgi:hypothetical protein